MEEMMSQERRQHNPEESDLWPHLTLSQRMAVTNLSNFGYKLRFIRRSGGANGLAILLCGENIATVDIEGEIESDPAITIR